MFPFVPEDSKGGDVHYSSGSADSSSSSNASYDGMSTVTVSASTGAVSMNSVVGAGSFLELFQRSTSARIVCSGGGARGAGAAFAFCWVMWIWVCAPLGDGMNPVALRKFV